MLSLVNTLNVLVLKTSSCAGMVIKNMSMESLFNMGIVIFIVICNYEYLYICVIIMMTVTQINAF